MGEVYPATFAVWAAPLLSRAQAARLATSSISDSADATADADEAANGKTAAANSAAIAKAIVERLAVGVGSGSNDPANRN